MIILFTVTLFGFSRRAEVVLTPIAQGPSIQRRRNLKTHLYFDLLRLDLPSPLIRHENRYDGASVLKTFFKLEGKKTSGLLLRPRPHRRNLKTRFYCNAGRMFRPTAYNNPSRKRSCQKTLFKPEEFENAGFAFSCGRKAFCKQSFSEMMTSR